MTQKQSVLMIGEIGGQLKQMLHIGLKLMVTVSQL
jgi:hypothetical protein